MKQIIEEYGIGLIMVLFGFGILGIMNQMLAVISGG